MYYCYRKRSFWKIINCPFYREIVLFSEDPLSEVPLLYQRTAGRQVYIWLYLFLFLSLEIETSQADLDLAMCLKLHSF